jgi:hypothetical protein
MHKSRLVERYVLLPAVLVLIVLAMPRPARASGPFDGNWTFKYSCEPATDLFADRCLRGEGDSFALFDLTQEGDHICGYHVATGYGQNKVDEGDLDGGGPSIYGTVVGNVATVRFRSARTKAFGVATITRNKTMIVWRVTKPISGLNLFPDEAVLSRDVSALAYQPLVCRNTGSDSER